MSLAIEFFVCFLVVVSLLVAVNVYMYVSGQRLVREQTQANIKRLKAEISHLRSLLR